MGIWCYASSSALKSYDFRAKRFGDLDLPVLLQVGSESPQDYYAADALAAVLPDVRIEVMQGQAHEGMTTAPGVYADAVSGCCPSSPVGWRGHVPEPPALHSD